MQRDTIGPATRGTYGSPIGSAGDYAASAFEVAMIDNRTKPSSIDCIQRDLEAIKHTLDKILRPYKGDVKTLRDENASLRSGIARANEDVERLVRFIAERDPETLDGALALLVDPSRGSWKKFRSNWRHRLGLDGHHD